MPNSTRQPIESTLEEKAMDDFLLGIKPKKNSNVAVFLGAGASKTFDYPVTRDLMFQIFKNLKKQKFGNNSRKQLHDFLIELLPGKRDHQDKLPLVTSVLSLLDYSLATGQALLPGWSIEQTREARKTLDGLLLETIPDDEWFEPDEEALFERFQKWIKSLKPTATNELGIITTNYDMISDLVAMDVAGVGGTFNNWSLNDLSKKIDFGFRWVDPTNELEEKVFARPVDSTVALYKLHGSTNWLRCPLCENIYINPTGPIAWIALEGGMSDDNKCHCSKTRLQAQLVSPSFIREMREPNLIAVWKSAQDFLRKAEHWVIIGYSFPDEDVAIRALFTRAFGSKSKTNKPTITVIQLDGKARINYESFFPDGHVNYLTGGLNLLLDRYKLSSKKI